MEQCSLSVFSDQDDGGAPARVYSDCILFEGPIPARLLSTCSDIFPGGFVSPLLARLSGATVAVGTQAGIARLCDFYRPYYLDKMRRFTEANSLPDSAAEWLAGDDIGSSALALFYHLTGIKPPGFLDRSAHPYDLADFRRCQLLIEALPDYELHFQKMESVSDEWAFLTNGWSSICASLDHEAPTWRSGLSDAPDTAKLFRKTLAGD